MTREALELMRRMDLRAAEAQVVLRCAPMIMGLKPSNLLILRQGEQCRVQQLFQNTPFSCCRLYRAAKEAVLLVYAPVQLRRALAQPKAERILWQHGYRDFSLSLIHI